MPPTPGKPRPHQEIHTELLALQKALARTEVVVRRREDRVLTELELGILEGLGELGRCKHVELCKRLRVDGAWLTRNLQALTARGWVQPSELEHGKRGARLELTEEGKGALTEHLEERDRLWRLIWARIPRAARGELAETVRTLNEAMRRGIEGNFQRVTAAPAKEGGGRRR